MGLKEIIDAVSTLGTLGFALVAVYAFLAEWIVPRSRLDEQRTDKVEAMAMARDSIHQQERLADAVETRNRLEEARIEADRLKEQVRVEALRVLGEKKAAR